MYWYLAGFAVAFALAVLAGALATMALVAWILKHITPGDK